MAMDFVAFEKKWTLNGLIDDSISRMAENRPVDFNLKPQLSGLPNLIMLIAFNVLHILS